LKTTANEYDKQT